ncbi:uncharacterized protein LOC108090005 [Drosophila ficusphila]|uniref:uncharacterized protein LOC108090005 n=1 Tax=Drosophila ficusphila TaxID=30025 RepID=UPI0007E80A6B|nr:uncharacterized protein LOC108090005 [Drosophila ficusphila]
MISCHLHYAVYIKLNFQLQVVLFTLLVATCAVTNQNWRWRIGTSSSYRYYCDWIQGKYKCTHIRCTYSSEGRTNCTTSVETPNIEAVGAATSYSYSCNWSTGKNKKCTYTRCTQLIGAKKNCTTSDKPQNSGGFHRSSFAYELSNESTNNKKLSSGAKRLKTSEQF